MENENDKNLLNYKITNNVNYYQLQLHIITYN